MGALDGPASIVLHRMAVCALHNPCRKCIRITQLLQSIECAGKDILHAVISIGR